MFDPEQVPLSTSEGRRPSSTAADRMMIGLAALALLGGVLIAVSRVLPEQSEQTSQATATPVQSPDMDSPTPRPTRSPPPARTMTVDPAPIPSAAEPSQLVSEWVRLRRAVSVLISPSSTAQPIGRLHRRDAAYVYAAPPEEGGAPGWLQVQSPTDGWIQAEIDDAALFSRFPYYGNLGSGFYGLAADSIGFTALSWSPDEQVDVMLASSDGVHWQRAESPAVAWGRAVASGPAGWLMVGVVNGVDRSSTVLWQSADAESWQPLGALPQAMADGVMALAGSEAGYVLLSNTGYGATGVWFSADGLLWTERPMAKVNAEMGARLTATPLGFFAWGLTDQASEAEGVFSVDGWTWSEANPIGPGEIVDVVADGDHLLALGRGPGGTRMWKGTIEGPQLTWAHDNTAPFRSAVVTRMVSDGERVIVLGWDRGSETPLWWQRGGLSWQRHRMPAAFGGLPSDAAGGQHGIVAIGRRASEDGRTPIFWHLGDGVVWEREPSPVAPAQAPPTPETCGPTPHDLLSLLSLDGQWAAICFGDTPITVRGWSIACDGCSFRPEGTYETEWLVQPTDERLIHLSPVESSDWSSTDAVLHPSVRKQPPLSRWLEVTGHFDDPQAASCRWTPTAADEYWYSGTDDVIAGCRARFVVTSVRPVSAP